MSMILENNDYSIGLYTVQVLASLLLRTAQEDKL